MQRLMFGKKDKDRKHEFGRVVRSFARPRSASAVPSTKMISDRLSRPFPVDETAMNWPQEYERRPVTSHGVHADREPVPRVRNGPARSIGYMEIPTPRKAVIEEDFLEDHGTYPQSLEDLYVHCGLIRKDAFEHLPQLDSNDILELWTMDNPVAAAHIMDLAKTWGLRCAIEGTLRLNDSGIWRRTRPGILDAQLREAYAKADAWIDGRLAIVGRHASKHVVQKHAMRRRVRSNAFKENQHEIFASSELASPVDKTKRKESLPLAVIELYAAVTGQKLQILPSADFNILMHDWRGRYPVSDHHLQKVVEKWSADIEPVNLDPGYMKLMNELGSEAVHRRTRGFSSVSVTGRQSPSISTQGTPLRPGATLRVVNQ